MVFGDFHVEGSGMRRLSSMRFREFMKIEEERGPLMRGMNWLMRVHDHLKNDLHASHVNTLAREQIQSIVGPMERRNKNLSERQDELWRAVLELDGPELSSKEISKEQRKAEDGYDWLERISRRVTANHLVTNDFEEALMTIAELRNQLASRVGELRQKQTEYQMAQAGALTRQFGSSDN